ncbi:MULTISPECIES: hypothetical protein [Pectobacterium]|uniref:hypothetical protein n=1 Tax=Pectobacterium TaxID=122277 RepID=UPI000EAE343A|nr:MULTISPECIES: hypothetical protein [Pectobacterium]AYH07373.1 hypothetical protein C5E25_19420 [Pectobacterium parmentieri]
MKLAKSSDTSGLTSVAVISDELIPVFDKLEDEFLDVNIELFFVFRCLPDKYERKSNIRRSKKDNTIYFDLTVSEDAYKLLSKTEQRHRLGLSFYEFFCAGLIKYKIDGLDLEGFIEKFGAYLKDIDWLKDGGFDE